VYSQQIYFSINNVRVNNIPAILFKDKTKAIFDKNYLENGTFIDKMKSQTINQEVIVQFKKQKEILSFKLKQKIISLINYNENFFFSFLIKGMIFSITILSKLFSSKSIVNSK
jgi:hypothetical protein